MNGAKRLSLSAWRSLTGAWLWLLLVTSVLVVLAIASLLPLSPPDSASQAPWQQAADLRYRQTTRLTQLFGLFEAFPALWYLGMGVGLLLNLAASNAQLRPRLWPFVGGPPAATHPGEFYGSHVRRQECPVSSLQGGLEVVSLVLRLSPCRYSLYREYDESAKCARFNSVRDRWSQAGMMVSQAATVAAAVACDCGGATNSG